MNYLDSGSDLQKHERQHEYRRYTGRMTSRIQQYSEGHNVITGSLCRGIICIVHVHINHLENVSSNIFQNVLSVLADVTAKIKKWRRWHGWG
jgi:hypothetical protein